MSGLAFGLSQLPVKWVPGVRQWRLAADDPYDFSTKVVNVWGIASTPVCPCGMKGRLDLDQNQSKSIALDWIM